jgi:hypothetical protein
MLVLQKQLAALGDIYVNAFELRTERSDYDDCAILKIKNVSIITKK